MKVAIVGAGFAGISTAKVLRQLGHQVTVYEKAHDVGGVWSRSRRYPGLRTQNNKGTYALSDMPMPRSYPEWPTGEQVQGYLEAYVDRFDLRGCLRLGTEVTDASPGPSGGWSVTTADGSEHYEHLVLASGIFSRPFVPAIEGVDVLTELGGELITPNEVQSLEQVRDKHVLVIGYGKSACDLAVEIATAAAATTVVARELLWKMPRNVGGLLNYKYLMLTRLGEGLFRYRALNGPERLLHARDSQLAGSMLGSVEKVTTRQLRLGRLGLVPLGTFSDIARSTVSLASEGFFEAVGRGSITVHRDTTIARFVEKDGRAWAELADGSLVRADTVIAATGWTQDIPFLPRSVLDELLDDNGDFLLYRQILPINVPDLTFAGYNSSFFSPLSAEMSAVWIGSYLGGHHDVPARETMLRETRDRLEWMRERTGGMHARGTNIIPFSMHNVDEVLRDVGIDVPRRTKAKQWLLPVDPSDYRRVAPRLADRLAAAR